MLKTVSWDNSTVSNESLKAASKIMNINQNEKLFLDSYDAYADAIFRFCYFKTGDRELSKDLTQDVFMKVWNYMQKGNDIKNSQAFLYRVANNLVIDWYRKSKSLSLDDLSDNEEESFDPPDPREYTIQNAEVSLAMGLLDKLEEDDKALIIWRFVEGMTPKDIAQEIGNVKENVVSVRIHRALKKLRALMPPDKNI
jgi:RNA polymerase sigma-70 factor (ECF subfamily)